MEGLNEHSKAKHPLMQAIILLFGAILGMLVFILLGFLAIVIFYGPSYMTSMDWAQAGPSAEAGPIKILLASQQLGLFLMPALMLAYFEKQSIKFYYGVYKPSNKLVFLTVTFMLSSMFVFSAINIWNQQISLPSFLHDVELWMKAKEDAAMETTKLILTMKTWGAFLSSLLVVGVIPAICEEFLFRGALQKVIGRIFANVHVQVWLAATIFSIIHFQFYGFFPRLLLGVAFGYLYVWSGNIWYAVIAHFVNNAFAVVLSFIHQSQGLAFGQEPEMAIQWTTTILSLALGAWFYFKFYKETEANRLIKLTQ